MSENTNYELYNAKGENKGVLVVIEHIESEISSGSLQLLGKGRELADQLGESLAAVVLGEDEKLLKELADVIVSYGADKVYVAKDRDLNEYRTLPYVRVISDLINERKPEIVLFTASTSGRDMAPRVAARIGTGLTADCTNLVIDDFEDPVKKRRYEKILLQIRPAFGGDVIATIVSPENYPQMATVRKNVFEAPDPSPDRKGEIIELTPGIKESDLWVTIEKVIRETKKTVDLRKAKIIVSGGRGLSKDPEKGFGLLKELADLLGGEVGASRGAVDNGWIDHSHQVGQTGQSVKPEVYIACGISGAVQHVAGMTGAKMVIAINKDPHASIFRYADFGLTEDAFDVIPKMIECLKKNGK